MVLDRKQRLLAACSRSLQGRPDAAISPFHAFHHRDHACREQARACSGDREEPRRRRDRTGRHRGRQQLCSGKQHSKFVSGYASMMEEGNSAEDFILHQEKPRNFAAIGVCPLRHFAVKKINLSKKAYKHRQ